MCHIWLSGWNMVLDYFHFTVNKADASSELEGQARFLYLSPDGSIVTIRMLDIVYWKGFCFDGLQKQNCFDKLFCPNILKTLISRTRKMVLRTLRMEPFLFTHLSSWIHSLLFPWLLQERTATRLFTSTRLYRFLLNFFMLYITTAFMNLTESQSEQSEKDIELIHMFHDTQRQRPYIWIDP